MQVNKAECFLSLTVASQDICADATAVEWLNSAEILRSKVSWRREELNL